MTKPAHCYICLPNNPAGKRIGIIKRGEQGYFLTDLDSERAGVNTVYDFVDEANERLGVDKDEAERMQVGSMFGWDVPGAR